MTHAAWRDLRVKVLKRIRPGEDERRAVESFRRKTEEELTELLRDSGLEAVAEVHGSASRGTWLAGEKDIDVFLILDPKYDRAALKDALLVAKRYVGSGWVEAYAEHPYIRASVDGFDVEFVPCFRVEPAKGLSSATDRTPLHTRFVNESLAQDQCDEVLLLKQFMRGIGVYGAEIKVGGFSGYLCELLVVRFGSFAKIMEDASKWRHQETICFSEGVRPEELRKQFRNPLIVVDPVDLGRNVASAVSETSMWTFVAAARAFGGEPQEKFFFPRRVSTDQEKIVESVKGRNSSLLFLVVKDDGVPVPDVLWGQLYKAEKAVSKLLSRSEFELMRSSVWSDERSIHILVFELESAVIPPVVRSAGPPVEMAENSVCFVRAHLGAGTTVSGPWIEGRRWWVESVRPYNDARNLLEAALRNGGKDMGVPQNLGQKIVRGHEILVDDEIVAYVHEGFTEFLQGFIRGRPTWLE